MSLAAAADLHGASGARCSGDETNRPQLAGGLSDRDDRSRCAMRLCVFLGHVCWCVGVMLFLSTPRGSYPGRARLRKLRTVTYSLAAHVSFCTASVRSCSKVWRMGVLLNSDRRTLNYDRRRISTRRGRHSAPAHAHMSAGRCPPSHCTSELDQLGLPQAKARRMATLPQN